MPLKIEQKGDKYCVVDDEGKEHGCHDSEKEASAQAAAINMNKSGITLNATNLYVSDSTSTLSNVTTISQEEPTEKMVELDGMSYEEVSNLVYKAFRDEYDYSGWVQETFEDFALVSKDRKLYKIPYTREGKSITFAPLPEWKEAEITREVVEKYFKSFAAVKELSEDRIGAYGVLFGDENRKDLHGEWFDEKTEELMDIFKSMGKIPFLFNHGHDEKMKSAVIGEVDVMEQDDIGIWFETKIKEHELYRDYVRPLIGKQALFPSSGTLPAAKEKEKSGYIKRWPIMEMTGTHIPAEHRMLDVPISEVKAYYKAIDVDFKSDQYDDGESEKDAEALAVKQKQLKLELDLMKMKGSQ